MDYFTRLGKEPSIQCFTVIGDSICNKTSLCVISVGLNSTANGSLTRPQLTDLEKSISQLSNIKSPDAPTTHGPMTPPHTYEHESNSVQMEMWQSHQRPLNRQASDSTFDREKPISVSQQKNLHQAPQTPAYVASLPPSG